MAVKTYVLLDSLDASAPIYQTIPGGKRVQIKKMPVWRPYLQVNIQDENGVNRTIRYKSRANSIYQDEQIAAGILANEKFTDIEYSDPTFKHGLLTTNKVILQKYLEAYPAMKGFKGESDYVKEACYKIYDEVADAKAFNIEGRLRAKAASKIYGLELAEAQSMLIRINGSAFDTPDDVEVCQNMLIQFLDDSELPGINAILRNEEELNIDETTKILIGKLINQGTLSFDKVEGKISKKTKQGDWVVIRDLSNEYSMDEKLRLFSDFLNNEDGKTLRNDLEGDLETEKPKKKAKQAELV